jgi:hypothetical protein
VKGGTGALDEVRVTAGELDNARGNEWRTDLLWTAKTRKIPALLTAQDNRSKFNVPLGIESQGFCILG